MIIKNKQINDRLCQVCPGVNLDALRAVPAIADIIVDYHRSNDIDTLHGLLQKLTTLAECVAAGMTLASAPRGPDNHKAYTFDLATRNGGDRWQSVEPMGFITHDDVGDHSIEDAHDALDYIFHTFFSVYTIDEGSRWRIRVWDTNGVGAQPDAQYCGNGKDFSARP